MYFHVQIFPAWAIENPFMLTPVSFWHVHIILEHFLSGRTRFSRSILLMLASAALKLAISPTKVLVLFTGEWDLEVSVWELDGLILLGCCWTQAQSVDRHLCMFKHTYIHICIYFSIYQSSIIIIISIYWKIIPILYQFYVYVITQY